MKKGREFFARFSALISCISSKRATRRRLCAYNAKDLLKREGLSDRAGRNSLDRSAPSGLPDDRAIAIMAYFCSVLNE